MSWVTHYHSRHDKMEDLSYLPPCLPGHPPTKWRTPPLKIKYNVCMFERCMAVSRQSCRAWISNYIHVKEWDVITHPHTGRCMREASPLKSPVSAPYSELPRNLCDIMVLSCSGVLDPLLLTFIIWNGAWILNYIHWNRNVFILMKFSSLAALEVVILTTSSAASD